MTYKEAYTSKPWLKYYPEGIPSMIEIPESSIPEVFDQTADKYADKTALIFYGKKITYKKLKELTDRFATALAKLGISKGDTIAIYLLNSPQYIISYFGILKLGATVTPISPVYTSHEIKHQIIDSEAKAIICEDILYDNVLESGIELKNVILSNIGEYLPFLTRNIAKKAIMKAYQGLSIPTAQYVKQKGLHLFSELIKNSPPDHQVVKINSKEDLAALPYTGGTTGLPKAAMLTHYNIIAMANQIKAFFPLFEEGKEVVVAFLPLYHIYGQVVVMLNSMIQGFTLILFTTPDFKKILPAMDRYGATSFYGVPTLYDGLKEYDKTSIVDWKKLKVIVCGADTLHESTVEGWERRTHTQIIEGYGMTESTSGSHVNPYNRPKVGSFGIPIPNVKAAIIDVDSTEFKPVGEVGEMILNGPNIMKGYWRREKDTAETLINIDGEIWLRTGDLVHMDEEGYFHFYDRKRDLIKYKGFSVFARHVEEVLTCHPMIKAAGVVGVPDPKCGQIIKAYVVLQGEARGKLSEEDILEYCKDNLAHYKVPQIIEFRGELPKTDVGKVSRRELREEGEEV
jgi:long-chain acyl-CoA synthetase